MTSVDVNLELKAGLRLHQVHARRIDALGFPLQTTFGFVTFGAVTALNRFVSRGRRCSHSPRYLVRALSLLVTLVRDTWTLLAGNVVSLARPFALSILKHAASEFSLAVTMVTS